jgi:hypothetical protein
MRCSGFAKAVAFEFLCGNQVRDPNVDTGTMGRYTSGPLGDCTDLVQLHPIAILIQFYDKLGGG